MNSNEKSAHMSLTLFSRCEDETAPVPQGGTVENTAADDGLQRLRELGVPEEKLTKRAQKAAADSDGQHLAPTQSQNTAHGQDAAATTQSENTTRRMSWEEIMADPEYNARMQAIVRRRLGESKSAAADSAAHSPADDGAAREELMQRHYMSLRQQAQQLRRTVPDFDLGDALNDLRFARLVAPGSGIDLRTAYLATRPADTPAPTPPRPVQPRPIENGAMPQAASVTRMDVRDKSYRQSIKKQMQQAAAQGRKLYPASSPSGR